MRYPNSSYSAATVEHFAATMTQRQLAEANNLLNDKVMREGPSDRIMWIEHTRRQLNFARSLQAHWASQLRR